MPERDFDKKLRPIAIVLPQFHPIPENDKWWGKGFTEWTNVCRAKPLYDGHYQPQLPADLGYYDLRLPEARQAQADLAKQSGIYGFCYYHYWFNGKRLLERPVNEILKSKQPDFPFMLCWANENWTRRWDGQDKEVLIAQEYNEQDDVLHMKHLMQYFKDPRYIRINNRPVFVVYKPYLLPNPSETAQRWRKVASENGLELYLCHMVFSYSNNYNKLVDGFDAAIDFEPFGIRRKSVFSEMNMIKENNLSLFYKLIRKIGMKIDNSNLNKVPYTWMYEELKSVHEFEYKLFPSIVPGWDNTARRKDNPALILDDSTPLKFETWLKKIYQDFEPYSSEENFIFVNAWNEWAEGNHLEPCIKWGRQFLDVISRATKG